MNYKIIMNTKWTKIVIRPHETLGMKWNSSQWEGVTSNLEYDWLMSSTSVGLSFIWRHPQVVFAFAQPFIIYS
jgi:hypothetical protein